MAKPYVVVAGNIGVGKTTLAELLGERFGWRPFYEPNPNKNPYLANFYKDMKSWAFRSQIFFLVRGLELHKQIAKLSEGAIQDRCTYEHGEIFAWNLKEVMGELDYQLYKTLYETLVSELPVPDLVIYLQASVKTLIHRIEHRGRGYEDGIPDEYLEKLNRLYEDWAKKFDRCSILTIPTDGLDFVGNPDHLNLIAESVTDSLQLNRMPVVVRRVTNPSKPR